MTQPGDALPPLSEAFCRRYRVSRLLGQGGMGTVHLAWDEELGRQVAIKFLRTFGETRDSLAGQRFEEEARVCAQLKHPRIVRLYTLDWEGLVPYLVFEFVMGSALADEIDAKKQLTLERTVSVGLDLLGALAAAHELGVVHRDVKPANVLVRAEDGRAMLADFGLARSRERTSFRTEKNLVLGTPAFMAPEVLRGEAAGPAADLYGVGCALYACLTGAPPLVGKNDVQTLEMQLRVQPTRLREVVAGVPIPLDNLIMSLLVKDPKERPGSAEKMAQALAELARREGIQLLSGDSGTRLPSLLMGPDGGTRASSRALGGPTQAVTVPSRGSRDGLRGPTVVTSKPQRPPTRESAGSRAPSPSRAGGGSMVRPVHVRRAGLAAGVLVVLAGLGLGAWWWTARGRVLGPRVVLQQGNATITWETPRELVGRVVVREDAPGGRSFDVWEPAPTRMHTATVRELKGGVPHAVDIVLTGDTPAWSARFTPPPPLAARLVSADATHARVAVANPPAGLTLRLAGAHDGEVVTAAATPGVFLVPHPAAEVSAGTHLEQILAPGVIATHPVDTVIELAARLADALDGFHAGPVVQRLVSLRVFDTWKDFPQALGNYNMLAHGEIEKYGKPDATTAPTDFYPLVLAEARKLPFWADVEAFRAEADGFFTEPSVPDAAKLHLYRGLLKLRVLDQMCAAQHDPRNLHVAALYAGLVKEKYTLPAPPVSGLPGLFPISSWQTPDFFDWSGMEYWVHQSQQYGRLHPDLNLSDIAAIKATLRSDRSARVPALPGAGGPGTAELDLVLCNLGPSYQFEIALAGTGDALPFFITQPGTDDWYGPMDLVAPPWPDGVVAPPSKRLPDIADLAWAQITLTFPARLLPPGALTVRVSYQHAPGVRIDKLANVQRLAHLRDLRIFVR